MPDDAVELGLQETVDVTAALPAEWTAPLLLGLFVLGLLAVGVRR